jgi:hypothetical protein
MLPGMLPRTGKPLTLGRSFSTKLLICLAPRAGFEPATNRLTAGCSTTELPGKEAAQAMPPHNKTSAALQRRKRRYAIQFPYAFAE